eukprot:GHVS01070818.1.p3 GENE.GHVS01070818.1~~GHVS01070818.1.p3  ORF type:complete len:100 (-),score=10.62 GHVS01070818.1:6-305(-)
MFSASTLYIYIYYGCVCKTYMCVCTPHICMYAPHIVVAVVVAMVLSHTSLLCAHHHMCAADVRTAAHWMHAQTYLRMKHTSVWLCTHTRRPLLLINREL